jgi:hypothetical protein
VRAARTNSGLFFSIALLALAPHAQAQYLECASNRITAPDAARAFSSAKRAAGSLKVIKSSLGVCMNPGRGRAWLDAAPESQPDGSELRHALLCTRGTGPWGCELSTNRYATIDVDRAGTRRHVEMNLPKEFDIVLARRLVAHAFELGSGLKNSDECGASPVLPETTLTDQRLQETYDLFGGNVEDITGNIDVYPDGSLAVIVNDFMIFFTPPVDGGDWQFKCWAEEVVVT